MIKNTNPRHNFIKIYSYYSNIWIENTFACEHKGGEHNGTKKTEFYRTNTKSQGLVPAHFALIIIIVVHVYSKISIS